MNIHAPLVATPVTASLEGRVSLVTGSTSGIGLGIARALAAAGSVVVLNGFGKPEDIAETRARMIAAFHVDVHHAAADMSNASSIAKMIATTLEAFGRIDVLVNNAGIRHVAPLDQLPAEKWEAILAINLSSAFHTTRLALPAMRANKFGRIINIASAHGLAASPFETGYVAARHGIVGLTEATALEAAEDNITCNAICPGYNRFATVEELGALSVFLASDAAASITGTALPVDGGRTAHSAPA